MSKISNAILTIEDMFMEAKKEYEFWEGELIHYGYIDHNAIAAAQYYGMMTALARANFHLLGDNNLIKIMASIDPKLYRSDFEKS